jgi:hypothetical protein
MYVFKEIRKITHIKQYILKLRFELCITLFSLNTYTLISIMQIFLDVFV